MCWCVCLLYICVFCEASCGTTVVAHSFWKLFFSFWELCFSKLFLLLAGLFHKLFTLPDCSCQSVESRQRFESIIDILHQDVVSKIPPEWYFSMAAPRYDPFNCRHYRVSTAEFCGANSTPGCMLGCKFHRKTTMSHYSKT